MCSTMLTACRRPCFRREAAVVPSLAMDFVRDTPKLSDGELDSALVVLPAWQPAEDRKSITRSFVAKNFVKGQ